MKRRKGFYSISVVAKMFSVHQQTIRMYEKQGLIAPNRSAGNTRLFSEEDVDRLEEVIYLTHKLGVNLAGVEMILKLQKKIKRMQEDMNKLFKSAEGEFEIESQQIKDSMRKNVERLAEIRKENIEKKRENLIEIPVPSDDEESFIKTPKKTMTKAPKTKTQQKNAPAKAEKIAKLEMMIKQPSRDEEEQGLDDVLDFEIEYDKD